MKLLHAADFHLDSPLSGLSREQSAQRRGELREIPGRLARLAKEEGVDLVLLPGDLFDGGRVYPETVRALAQALGEMEAPVFIAPGNHDYYHDKSPYAAASWPDNVYIFTQPAIQAFAVPQLNCVVHGCAFTGPRREDDPLAGFSARPDGRMHLLCLHAEVGQMGMYAPVDPKSLEESRAAYAALGHVHTVSRGLAGQTFWAYPGCPEGRGFDELGPRGALIVSIEEGGASDSPVAAKFVPVCRRQYRVESAAVDDPRLFQGESPDLVRFLLTGESPAPPDLAALTARAAPHFFYVELRDRTTLPKDLWARAAEDSLTGLFLREMRARLDGAAEDQQEKLLLATRFGLAALEGGEDVRP